MMPVAADTTRITPLYESEMYMFPTVSTAVLLGPSSAARVAGPPSPV